MADPAPAAKPAPKWKPLDEIQRRVLGVLIEKAKTTPAGYPMSVNAIVAGCNQKNNREPLMTLDDFTVEKALDQLRNLGAVSEIDWLGRVSKFKHHGYEWMGVNNPELAVMTELLLRGAQALGDLRGRAARMDPIEDLAALKPIVSALVERGLMVELTPAGRGQIVSHNLYLEPEREALRASLRGDASRPASTAVPAIPASATVPADRATALSAEIAELRTEVMRLRELVGNLTAKLDFPTAE
jgi:uncharacterized protein YceH (UPF0502 family)